MKILLANKYFFPNGGTEVYLRTLLDELPKLGHACLPFSTAFEGSWPSGFSRFFLPPPGDAGAARLEHMRLTPGTALTLLERSTYSFTARKYLGRLLDAEKNIDVALALNIYNYMSPSIFHEFSKRSIPIAMQIGDYHLMCPQYQFLRDNKPCFLCQKGDYYNGVRHRCVKGSLAASGVRAMAMYIQRWMRIWNLVDLFLVPCRFMRDAMAEGGFDPERIRVMPYPVRVPPRDSLPPKGDYILSFGRVSREKGLDVLVKGYQKARPQAGLLIVGRDYDGERSRLESLVEPAFRDRILFRDFTSGPELARLIGGALLTVVPSRWHDNAPLSVYESLAHATPVAGAAMGGIPEQIREGVDGVLFDPDDSEALAAKLDDCLSDRLRLQRWGNAGRERMAREHDPGAHAALLADILSDLRGRRIQ